jgi:hypothetical protein
LLPIMITLPARTSWASFMAIPEEVAAGVTKGQAA